MPLTGRSAHAQDAGVYSRQSACIRIQLVPNMESGFNQTSFTAQSYWHILLANVIAI